MNEKIQTLKDFSDDYFGFGLNIIIFKKIFRLF